MAFDINTLDMSILASREVMKKAIEERTDSIKQFVGAHYATNGASKAQPTNLLEMMVTIYLRLLASRAPKCVITTDFMALKPMAKDFEIVVNQIPNEIGLRDTIRHAVAEAMFSVGIVKVGIAGTEMDKHIGDQPFVSLVQFDDYIVDMSAKTWDEIQYEGNEYWLTVDQVKQIYGEDAMPEDYNGQSKDGIEQAKSIEANQTIKPLYDRVRLRDIYLTQENRMVTYLVDTKKVVRDIPWDGPEGTPYIKLGFNDVPGNLLPLAPIATLKDMHELGNALYRKLADQAVKKKTVVTFDNGSDDDIERFKRAKDGDGIRSTIKPNEVTVGGVDAPNLAFYIQNKDLFSMFAGNLDSLGGLGAQTDTATQDKLISEAASARVQKMADRTIEFAQDIFKRLAWYVWTDPIRERKYVKWANKRLNIGIEKMWTPETRDGDFLDFNFSIAVFSMQDDSPAKRVEKFANVFQNFILPGLQDIMQQGGMIDWATVTEFLGQNINLPELTNLIKFGNRPPDGGRQPGGNPRPDYVSTKSPISHRVYERKGRPGMTRQGRDAVMMQTLLGGNLQGQEKVNAGVM